MHNENDDTEHTDTEDDHLYVDRDKIDFDPDDGLLSGTAVDGTSEIPGSPSNPENDDDDKDDDDDDKDGDKEGGA